MSKSKTTASPAVVVVTDRRMLEVDPGWLRGAPARVHVDVCVTCGSVVFEVGAHELWHRSLAPTAGKAGPQ